MDISFCLVDIAFWLATDGTGERLALYLVKLSVLKARYFFELVKTVRPGVSQVVVLLG